LNAPTKPPERAINAIRRVAPATRVLATACQIAGIGAALAAMALWAAIGLRIVTDWPWGTIAAVVLAVVLAAPAVWLLHAGATLHEVAQIPRMVTTRPERPTITKRDELRRLRHGGVRQLARTVRTTVGEYGAVVGPWRAAIEISTPWFWTWTGAAAVAAAAEIVLIPVAAVWAALA
jgi:hypothetical protein